MWKVGRSTKIDDIPVPQFTLVRNAVANDLVDRSWVTSGSSSCKRETSCVRADGFWEFPIAKGRGVCIPINDSLMDYGINFVRGDSRAHVGCSQVEHLPSELGRRTSGVSMKEGMMRKKTARLSHDMQCALFRFHLDRGCAGVVPACAFRRWGHLSEDVFAGADSILGTGSPSSRSA